MKLAHELHQRECKRCGLSRPVFEFARCGKSSRSECSLCVAGRHRFAALARSRPLVSALRGDAREFALRWETARVALKRYLSRQGVRVTLHGVAGSIEEPRAPSSAELSSRP